MKDSSKIFDNRETSPPVDFWHGHNSQLVMMRLLKNVIGPAIYYIIQKGRERKITVWEGFWFRKWKGCYTMIIRKKIFAKIWEDIGWLGKNYIFFLNERKHLVPFWDTIFWQTKLFHFSHFVIYHVWGGNFVLFLVQAIRLKMRCNFKL